MLLDVVHSVLPLVLGLVDEVPEAEDVKAGSIAFVIFIAGFVALGLLGWSLVRHLRKVEDARERGVFGDQHLGRAVDCRGFFRGVGGRRAGAQNRHVAQGLGRGDRLCGRVHR